MAEHPVDDPVAPGGVSGTTIGPATPTAPWWMCAAVAGAVRPYALSVQQTVFAARFRMMVAAPVAPGWPPAVSFGPAIAAVSTRIPPDVTEVGIVTL